MRSCIKNEKTLAKKKLAENEPSNTVKKSILTARRSRSTNRNTPTEVPVVGQTKKNKKVLQNETEIITTAGRLA